MVYLLVSSVFFSLIWSSEEPAPINLYLLVFLFFYQLKTSLAIIGDKEMFSKHQNVTYKVRLSRCTITSNKIMIIRRIRSNQFIIFLSFSFSTIWASNKIMKVRLHYWGITFRLSDLLSSLAAIVKGTWTYY